MSRKPEVTESGGSKRITIPSNITVALDIEGGDQPEEVRYDEDAGQVTFEF